LDRRRSGSLGDPIVIPCRHKAELFLSGTNTKRYAYVDTYFFTEDEDKRTVNKIKLLLKILFSVSIFLYEVRAKLIALTGN